MLQEVARIQQNLISVTSEGYLGGKSLLYSEAVTGGTGDVLKRGWLCMLPNSPGTSPDMITFFQEKI